MPPRPHHILQRLLAASLAAACSGNAAAPALPTAVLRVLPASTSFPTSTPVLAAAAPAKPIAASAVPLPSPTPWNHAVRDGETLLGIALRYGITLEALLVTNPGINAQLIRIGQLVQLPVNASELRTPGGTDMPSANVAIDPPACYPTASGSTYCVASLHNNDTVPLTNIQVTFTALSAAGDTAESQAATVQVELLWPGDSAALHAWFAPGTAAASAKATLLTATAASGLAGSFARLTTSNVTFDSTGGAISARGMLTSVASLPLMPVHIMVMLYNLEGRICSYSVSVLPTVLEPQASASFETSFGAVPCPVGRVDALAWGQIATATPTN